jgi:hypothetical protein
MRKENKEGRRETNWLAGWMESEDGRGWSARVENRIIRLNVT